MGPAVWRRLLVPGSLRLDKFHLVLQAAMAWTNSDLHNFSVGHLTYGSHLVDGIPLFWPLSGRAFVISAR